MKYITVLLLFFMFSTISYAQDGPLEGTKEGIKLEKELEERKPRGMAPDPIVISGHNREPLLIISGIVVDDKILQELDPSKIAKVNVLKDEKSTAIYGDSGKNGVIVIKLKKKYKKKFLKMMEKEKRKE